jgi:hypothetical protein
VTIGDQTREFWKINEKKYTLIERDADVFVLEQDSEKPLHQVLDRDVLGKKL